MMTDENQCVHGVYRDERCRECDVEAAKFWRGQGRAEERESQSLGDQLERSVALCRVAREKERAAVVRWLRTNKYYADHSLEFANDIEAGDHVRDELRARAMTVDEALELGLRYGVEPCLEAMVSDEIAIMLLAAEVRRLRAELQAHKDAWVGSDPDANELGANDGED